MHYLEKEVYERISQDPSLFEFIQNAALDGLWYWDLEHPEHEWMNAKFWQILGYNPAEMPHTPAAWQDIIFEEDLAETKQTLEKYLEAPEGNAFDQIIRYRHKEGHTVWIRCRGMARFDEHGKPLRMLGAHTDVSELKRMEAKYRQEARYYESLLETQTSYICRINAAGNYIYVNNKFSADFGIPKPSPEYTVSYLKSVVEEDHPKLREIFTDLLQQSKKTAQTYIRIYHSEGRINTIYWEFTLIKGEASKPAEIQGVGLDFTGQVADREALRENQKALEASETLLRSFINSTTGNIVLLSPDYKVLLANRVVKEQVKKYYNGRKLQVGDDIRPYILPAAKPLFEDAVARAKAGETVRLEFEADCGVSKRWLEFTYFPVYNADGSLLGISFNSVDIDERKRAQEQLRASEERLRGVLQSQTSYLVRTDLLGNYTYANKKFRDTFRYIHGDGDLVGRSSMESIIPEDHDMVIEKVTHLINHPKDILQFEIRKPVVNGKALTSLWEFSCITNAEGQPVEIQCIGFDITSRKANELKLRESEAYQRSLLRAIPMLLFVMSAENRYLDYSAKEEDLYRPPEAFLGKLTTEVLPADLAAEYNNAIQEALQTNKTVKFSYAFDIQGKERHFEARAVAMAADKVLVSVNDITYSVKNLNRIKALLENREEQNRRLNNFTHIVSHNLRNHTANIQGVLGMLGMDAPEIYANEYIGMMKKTSDNLSETIKQLNQILDIRLNTPESLTDLNLRNVIETTADSVGQLARDAGVEIKNEVSADIAIATVPAYLHSIVLNMITNAIKYRSEERNSYIRITCEEQESGLLLSFEDNGLGINLARYGAKIFGMYKTFHHHEESRGLGLFISKNQAEALGGTIQVRSEVDRGTCFEVFLPFRLKEEE